MHKSVLLCLLMGSAAAFASAADIHIAETVPYEDESRIDNRITSECTEIGSRLSQAVEKYARENQITVIRDGNTDPEVSYAKLHITSAMSAGNAFIGHAKGMSVYGELYRNGQPVHKTTFNRNSMGGMFGGFKGSCTVLYRTANALGKDIAAWLATQNRP
ncbi:hypothetical protein [Neisseria dumasiana]|uniref:hypothetical protein n=1 Tax=Neisseria dumasiana TaxID=1931275 RepID=UPI000A18B6B7|nr:hypothetical protein [Neisseria dumasiana]OSI17388.1 hypothetical protein BV914_01220 [Neisseria dumasiana]